MQRTALVILFTAMVACNNNKQNDASANGFSFENFSGQFKKFSVPYQLSDTGLIKNRDTTSIRVGNFSSLVPDSLRMKYFGKVNKVKYVALGFFTSPEKVNFYLIKAQSGTKKIALLLAFIQDQYSGIFPFLVPDNDPTTFQVSMIDRSFSIQKNVSQRKPGNLSGEGKDVYDYDIDSRLFSLTLTNPLNNKAVFSNPIDTLPRKHKFAGDYGKDKRNFVAVRDGRYPNQLLVYMHIDKNNGGCTGELKGDILLTSSTTAIYRQGGDPCVLSIRFTPSAVIVKEDEGCGSHRGLDCLFDGTFSRKKETKSKSVNKKK